jgi:hypothetical protein
MGICVTKGGREAEGVGLVEKTFCCGRGRDQLLVDCEEVEDGYQSVRPQDFELPIGRRTLLL